MIDRKINRNKRYNKSFKVRKPVSKILVIIAFTKLLWTDIFWKTMFELCFTYYVLKYRRYYTHIDYLPLFNFSEIMKGKFEYLYEGKKNKRVPKVAFAKIFEEMNYQFKTLDNSHLRDLADLADYEYKIVEANDKRTKSRWQNEWYVLQKKIENKKRNKFDLSEFTDYIEQTFNFAPGSIDVHKISTAKAFNNYQKAIEINRGIAINRRRK